jgi:glycosyltransferase involved in cell wall biosynthesis
MPQATPDRPAVSVVIPCFQGARYLAEAVESVVAQTVTDWEIVIVDDGSTDGSAEVAEALMRSHPARQIRLLRQSNEGTPTARNAGIAASVGRYILPLDADDILLPQLLEKTVAALDAEPNVAIVYTDYRRFGSATGVVNAGTWSIEQLCYSCPLSNTSLYRREVWDAVGGYNPNMAGGYEDWDFWIGAAERGFIGTRIAEPLWLYRKAARSRNVNAIAAERRLLRQLRDNHRSSFTPRRRVRNVLRHQLELLPGRLRYWTGRLRHLGPSRGGAR